MSNKPDRLYLCDGYACDEKCAEKSKADWDAYNCHHTSDESHARNKCRRSRKWATYKEGAMVEVE